MSFSRRFNTLVPGMSAWLFLNRMSDHICAISATREELLATVPFGLGTTSRVWKH